MIRDITLGQYYPVDSVIHRMDPRTKLFGTMVFIISLFLSDNIGALTSNATIASLGKTLGRGALISIVLVMSVLPQLLLVGDKLIDKAELTRSSKRGQEKEEASES